MQRQFTRYNGAHMLHNLLHVQLPDKDLGNIPTVMRKLQHGIIPWVMYQLDCAACLGSFLLYLLSSAVAPEYPATESHSNIHSEIRIVWIAQLKYEYFVP